LLPQCTLGVLQRNRLQPLAIGVISTFQRFAAIDILFNVARCAGKCRLYLIQNVTLTQILATCRDSDLHDRMAVFHFAGHADSYELLMEVVAGKEPLVDAGRLAAFLGQQPGANLAFLDVCGRQEEVTVLQKAGVLAIVTETSSGRLNGQSS
jgi:hypothetical protein